MQGYKKQSTLLHQHINLLQHLQLTCLQALTAFRSTKCILQIECWHLPGITSAHIDSCQLPMMILLHQHVHGKLE
jgi:hypothetical protein